MNDTQQHLDHLQSIVQDLLGQARQQGASAAEAGVSMNKGLSLTARMGEVETVERSRDQSLGVTVYFGQRKGSASTTDLSPEAVRDTVGAACRIARLASEDRFAGLADPERLARDIPDLDLYHPWEIEIDAAAELARRCEAAALEADPRIDNSEGATLSTGEGAFVYGNSLGFIGGYPSSRHSLSCAVVARDEQGMQRDYWYDTTRLPGELADPEQIGRQAARRTLDRLGARKLPTGQAPVLFRAEMAPGLLRSLVGAIRGHALYRKASFLLDQLDQPIFPEWVQIAEDPLAPRGLASAPFDSEGVQTYAHDLVTDGILRSYVLDSYAARKLGMTSTGNAGGVRNLSIAPSAGSPDLPALIRQMDRGLIVTELMGQGVNPVTGDYSRGAAGFWVEGGEIQYPVQEITVAGNLKDMYRQLVAVGADDDIPSSIRTGSWLIESLSIAGS